MAAHPKLIVIGIDGATWDLMDPWLLQGELPHIASVIGDGCRSELRSVVPPITGCAWPTIMTGVNPGRHGMFGFASYEDDYIPRPVSNRSRRAPALWEMLNYYGLTVGVYNVPMTYPPNEVDGYLVSGEMGAVGYDPSMFEPPELFEEIRQVVPSYELAPVVKGLGQEHGLERLQAQVEARRRAAAYLLERHPTDVFITVINYVDHVQHRFMKNRSFDGIDDMLLWSYQRADEFVGEVLSHAGPDTAVMIISDHGAGPISGFIDPDALLCQLGYRSYRRGRGSRGPLKPVVGGLRTLYGRFIKPHLSTARHKRLRLSMSDLGRESEPDWERTRAYAAGPYLCIRLNVRGREARGCVNPEDFYRARDDLIDVLNEVVNPHSGETDLQAHPAEDFYAGEHTTMGPDIVGMPQDFALETVSIAGNTDRPFPRREDIPQKFAGKRVLEGTHRMNGVFAAKAADAEMRLTAGPQLTDVAPTALALLSLPVPANLDGRVLLDLPYAAGEAAPLEGLADGADASGGYDHEEARKVEQRLRDLGYM